MQLARRSNPGLAAGTEATAAIEAQLSEARRSWFPTGEVSSLIAPSPEVQCQPDENIFPVPPGRDAKEWREEHCYRTNISDATVKFKGVFTRTELRLVQPLFTFGKISAGVEAAKQGVAASKHREAGQRADVALNVQKAYWGAKLAREVLQALAEGIDHLDDAQKKVNKDLEEGGGNNSPADRWKLRVARAEAESRRLEARKMESLAKNGLRALIGPEAPADLQVDGEELALPNVPQRPVTYYEEQALQSRPELRALDHLVASKRALADLEARKQLPDLVLVGSATFARASSIDNPQNAFASDPFNTTSAALGAALRLPVDLFVRNAKANRLRAEAAETGHRRRDALGGIEFEVQKAYGDLVEAQERAKIALDGEKAGKGWLSGLLQKSAVGLTETKEFSDALLAYFQWRVKHLQAIYDVNIAAAQLERATGAPVVAR